VSSLVRPAAVDEAVRHRVRSSGLHETLFVEAGAGSGKTTLLVERIVNLVLEAGVSLASIGAITFTEAAASELQSRIRAQFEQVLAQAREVGDEARADLCRRAIADTDLAAITTLHGFANRILAEFAVAAGLPPQIRVLDEVSSQLAHEDRWQRFVDRLYDSDEHEELLLLASALQIPIEPRYTDQSTMRTVATQFNQNWDRLGELIDADRGPLGTNFDFADFDSAVERLATWPDQCHDPGDKLKAHLLQLLPGIQAVQAISDPLRKIRALRQHEDLKKSRGGAKLGWGSSETVTQVKDDIVAVNEAAQQTLQPIMHDVLLRLSAVIAAETLASAHVRRSDGGLEFHDLLVLARDVLRNNPEARRALHERYQHLLLDEFQDTDPIQIELAVLIATSATDVAGLPWSTLPVDPGRLFFVGDPKQSIYRFRRADIALFLNARDTFAGPQGSAQLEANFRTVSPIVDWVNALFSHEMPTEVPGAQPKYQPLMASRSLADPEQTASHVPVLLGGPHSDPKIKAGELRSVEADDVVGVVRAIVADPESWPVQDKSNGEWRPATLNDITILLPTRTSLPFLRAGLDDAELRYRIVTGTLVYDTQEVVDALAALRAIDDPGDELSLVAALRSPLYACSDVDLVTWRQAGGRWDVRATVPESISPEAPVAAAIRHLRELWNDRWFLTPSMLLERLLRERRAALLAFGDPRTTDVWRRLRFLVEQARAFEEANSGDVRAFTQWAALQGGSMARVHEPMLPETDEASLSIQTIHGSKGLEFPITILSGMTTQLGRKRPGVTVLWPETGVPSVQLNKGVQTHEHGPRADIESAMDEYERIRLAYVATTRARDHLIVSCHHKTSRNPESTYGGRFWQIFDDPERRELFRVFDWREVVGSRAPEPPRASQLGLALDNREQWVAERRQLLGPAEQARVLSATGVAQAALDMARGNATELARTGEDDQAQAAAASDAYLVERLIDQDDDGADQPEESLIGRRRGRTGSAIGSAVHAVLQLVDLRNPTQVGDLVSQQCEIEAIPDRAGIVRRLVEVALASQAVALASEHPHHKELFVTAPISGRTIEGYVDLLIESPDGLVVVDYKTDAVRTDADVDAKLAAYELQAAAYAVALEQVTLQPVVECRFVFCTTNGAIERAVLDLVGAKERVRSTVAALG